MRIMIMISIFADKKRSDFRKFLANHGIASHHIDKLEGEKYDSIDSLFTVALWLDCDVGQKLCLFCILVKFAF